MDTEAAPPETRASRLRLGFPDYSLSLTLVLTGGLLLTVVIRYLLAREIATPWIMADELIYSELAKNFADSGEFMFREWPSHLNNLAYPALIAPAWLAPSVDESYSLARAINAVLMVLAAVPVYFWGRRLMPQAYALLAAVLVLLMPSLLYTGMLMTENAFFLAVVTSCFLIALTLERPTVIRQGLTLGAIGVTCLVRPQGLALFGVFATALVLKLVFDLRAPDAGSGFRHVLAELRRFVWTAGALVVLAFGYVLYASLKGEGLETFLGAYGGVVKVEYDFASVRAWVVDHFAEISFSVGLIPVSALIVLFGLALWGRTSSAAERAFVAVAASAFVLIVLEVATYASRFALRIEERNMFSVAPLCFLALCLWLARGLPRPVALTAVAAALPAVLLLTLDLPVLLNIGILSDTFGLVPLMRMSNLIDGGVDRVELLMRLGGAAAALAFALLPRKIATAVLPLTVAAFLVLSSYSVFGAIREHATATLALMEASDPSWIDARIGTKEEAPILYGGTADLFTEAQILWQTEFWNRSVGSVYNLGPPDPAAQAGNAASMDYLTGRIVFAQGVPRPTTEYVVAPTTVSLRGRALAQTGGLVLYRVRPPLRLATHIGGIYSDGWMRDFAALTHYGKPVGPGRLSVRVSREGWGGESPPGKVTIRVGTLGNVDGEPGITDVIASRSWTVRSGIGRDFTLPTPAVPYRLEIRVDPTFTPADYGMSDTRQLGAQVQIEPVS
ncbi:MAG: hypothetical protein ACRDNH_01230 [Gaiellaceae bacterium]